VHAPIIGRDGPGAAPAVGRLRLVVMLALITIVSQFHRASLGVIAPELIRDLSLTPQMLGLAGGAFFLALVVVQLPLGVALDRVGPRRLVGALTIVAVAGALLSATAQSGPMLVAARLALGLGSSAAFMAAVVMCSRWFAGERLASALSWVFALSQLGILLASSPLALASETIGWRWAFVLAAVITGAVGFAFWLLVTADHPDGSVGSTAGHESMRDAFRGIAEVLRTPNLPNVLAVQAVAYACIATVLGLWAGPYLFDVHGLEPVARGHVIALMTVAHIAGVLACGPLDARLNTRRGIVVAGGAATAVLLAVLALMPGLPTAVAIALLVAMCVTMSFGPTLVAHGRSLFPDRLAGRGMTTLNLAQVVGASLLPLASGAIAAALSPAPSVDAAGVAVGGGYPEVAYRAIFGLLAFALAAGVWAYSRGADSKPRPA